MPRIKKQQFNKYLRFIWRGQWWHKALILFSALVIFSFGAMYGIAEWYIHKHANDPLKYGVTFIPNYARDLGLDPEDTFDAITDDLKVKRFRLVSYWKDIEKTQGIYDFKELDWQFEKAQKAGAEVSLAIGLRQPRWPECHIPSWAENQPMNIWYPQLKTFMKKVVQRYQNNPSLQSYQLENEFFLTVFGNCPDFTRDRLVDEFNYVKKLDSKHPIIVSRSNNWLGVPIGQPEPDQYGISIYKRVFDAPHTGRYVEYPLPPWYYSFLAGASEILTGKDMIIHELQAETWLANDSIQNSSLEEQRKSLNADRLAKRFDYAKETGIKTVDLWGVEYWYYVKEKRNDPSLWNTAIQQFANQ